MIKDEKTPLIIGSGPAAIAVAQELVTSGIKPVILDFGLDFDSEVVIATSNSGKSFGRKTFRGSTFPYFQPKESTTHYADLEPVISFATGGFSNIWGATVQVDMGLFPMEEMPLDEDLLKLISLLRPSNVNRSIGSLDPGLDISVMKDEFKRKFDSSKYNVMDATLAIQNDGSIGSCRKCSNCITGCVYQSIWNSKYELRKLIENQSVTYVSGFLAQKIVRDRNNQLSITGLLNSEIATFESNRIYLATGAISAATILIQSGYRDEFKLQDTATAYSALFRFKPVDLSQARVTLSHTWIQDSSNLALHQIYPPSNEHREKIASYLPKILRRRYILNWLVPRFHPIISYISAENSGQIVVSKGKNGVIVTTRVNTRTKRIFRKTHFKLARAFIKLGLFLPFLHSQIPNPGSGYHFGAMFDFDSKLNNLGEPFDIHGLSIVGAASLRKLPIGSITPTLMLNAIRIAREASKKDSRS